MTNVEALKGLYVVLGGKLTDTYSDIANGVPVSDYNTIPECILAVTKKATGAIELPVVSSTDNGDVLTVVDGAWNKSTPSSGLPDVTTTDEGKVLTVDSEGAWAAENPGKELPTVTTDDNGDVLTVVEGAWAKAAPSSGGGDILVIPAVLNLTNLTVTFEKSTANIINDIIANPNKEVIVYAITSNGQVKNIFRLTNIDATGYQFIMVGRTASATYYRDFALTASTATTVNWTAKTINDPA